MALRTLTLAAAVFLTASAPSDLLVGRVVPKVVCAENPGQSYALYLPSGYRPDRAWPILYAFDARAQGEHVANVFREGAERFGWIVASSNTSLSDTVMEPNFAAMRAMWADTRTRFRIDDRRVYAAGFSGTVRAACVLAFTAPGSIAGIVGAGAGFPFDRKPTRDTPFAFFGTVGIEDFNYYEMLDLEAGFAAVGRPFRLEIFDGTHDWPPPPLAARALGWMELQAMRAGTREKDPALLEALWKEDFARGRAQETAGDLYQAWRTFKALAADFTGLRETGEAARKGEMLFATPQLQNDLAAREARQKRDQEYRAKAPRQLSLATVGQAVSGLRIAELKKRAASDDQDEAASARRLLHEIIGQTGFYLPEALVAQKSWDRAAFVLSVSLEIDPDRPSIWYRRAVVYALQGDRKKALEDLEEAVDRGWHSLAAIEQEEAFAGLRDENGYREIVKALTPAEAPPRSPRGQGDERPRQVSFSPFTERAGEVLPKVVCRDNPAKSYALYLPKAYTPDRSWPILYVFDSQGIRSEEPLIARFVPGAERFGWILASSNDTANAVPMDENIRSLGALWADTHTRFAVDDKRAYGFGFSGMARMITTAALRSPGTLQGVIVGGSGFPVGQRPSQTIRFPYFAVTGETDFSYYELLDLEGQLDAAGFTHRVEVFDGSHQWPPAEVAAQAMAWLELLAMKTGTRPKDSALVDRLWNEDLDRARTQEDDGKRWRAWRTYRAMAQDFATLAETVIATERAATIEQDASFKKHLKEREARDRRDREFLERAPRIFTAAGPENRPDTKSQLIADLKIPDWQKRARSTDRDERLAAERVLYALYIQLGLYLPRDLLEKKQWDRAILYLEVADVIDPDSPRIPYRLATAYAGKGNKKQALAELEKALQRGGTDRAEIAADPAFAGLKESLPKP